MRARTWIRLGTALLAAPLLAACSSGILYRHVREPLTVNFDRTPNCIDSGGGDIQHIHIPFSQIDFDVLWNSNAIGDIAKKMGLAEIYYADLETLSIVSIWNRYTVHVYGRRAEGSASDASRTSSAN